MVPRLAEGEPPGGDAALRHGKPLVYGRDRDRGLRMNGYKLEVVKLGGGVTEADLTRHDETDRGLAFLLSQLAHPEFPEPIRVLGGRTGRFTIAGNP